MKMNKTKLYIKATQLLLYSSFSSGMQHHEKYIMRIGNLGRVIVNALASSVVSK